MIDDSTANKLTMIKFIVYGEKHFDFNSMFDVSWQQLLNDLKSHIETNYNQLDAQNSEKIDPLPQIFAKYAPPIQQQSLRHLKLPFDIEGIIDGTFGQDLSDFIEAFLDFYYPDNHVVVHNADNGIEAISIVLDNYDKMTKYYTYLQEHKSKKHTSALFGKTDNFSAVSDVLDAIQEFNVQSGVFVMKRRLSFDRLEFDKVELISLRGLMLPLLGNMICEYLDLMTPILDEMIELSKAKKMFDIGNLFGTDFPLPETTTQDEEAKVSWSSWNSANYNTNRQYYNWDYSVSVSDV